MALTINIYYTGSNGSAKSFAEEMINSGNKKPNWIDIQEYIEKKRGISVNNKTISNTLAIYRNCDSALLETILEGRLSIRDANILAPVYKEMTQPERNKVVKEIWEGRFNSKKFKKKEEKKKTIKWTNAKVEDLLSRIKMNVLTIDEAIEIVRNNGEE